MKRVLPFAAIVATAALVLAFGLDDYISIAALQAHEARLQAYVAQAPILSAFIYVGFYIIIVALSLPAATVVTLTGGLVFGIMWGGVLAVTGATIGAVLLFQAARTAIGESLRRRAGAPLQQFEAGFRRDAVSYLLMLRLIPIFPFFLINIAASLTGVSFWVFAITTAIGIAPGSFIYVSVGNSLSVVLAQGGVPELDIIFRPDIFLPLTGLGLLMLAPIIWRIFQARRKIKT